tara:strand:- start:2184 stop:2708 length:525 start_codon:yes stop_codon:yes gene_type:complete
MKTTEEAMSIILRPYKIAYIHSINKISCSCIVTCPLCKNEVPIALYGWTAIKCMNCGITLCRNEKEYLQTVNVHYKTRYLLGGILNALSHNRIHYELDVIEINEVYRYQCNVNILDWKKFLQTFLYALPHLKNENVYQPGTNINISLNQMLHCMYLPPMTCEDEINITLIKNHS